MNKIEINRNWCKKCGLCAKYCPKNVYEIDFYSAPQVKNLQDCIGCMICEYRCPDFAISVTKDATAK